MNPDQKLAALLKEYTPARDCLAGRTILITGAADGIGRAVAKRLAGHQATVILLDRNVPRLETIYDEIEASGAPQPAIYPLNLEGATQADYRELAATIRKKLGQLHGVIHNAAHFTGLTAIEHFDYETWLKTLQVNLNAPFLLTQVTLPMLREVDAGAILFTSCNIVHSQAAYWGAYGVSKYAIEGFARILHEEVEANTTIRVNLLDPGPVRSHLRSLAYPAEDAEKLPVPEAITTPYVLLMDPALPAVRGQRFALEEEA
ncbi:MAG: SDR family NAD(P)-dependent oxidoreductase [Gammaproteobacteria bacterium]|nr:MAG: SDR family NAD(P)-dependent oxidoreductase [Gammaproteobacteria bacterium]